MEPEYLDKVHGIMQGVYGDKFTLDVDTFKDKMINETQYRDKIYGIMQGVYGDKFTLDPKTFYNKVLESSKKKSQSEIGSQATQLGDGSENAQYAFEPGMQEQPTFQGVGKAIEKNLGVTKKVEPEIPYKQKEDWQNEELLPSTRMKKYYESKKETEELTPEELSKLSPEELLQYNLGVTEKAKMPNKLQKEIELEDKGLLDVSKLSDAEKEKYKSKIESERKLDRITSAEELAGYDDANLLLNYYNDNIDKIKSDSSYTSKLNAVSNFKKELEKKYGANFDVTMLSPQDADIYNQLSNMVVSSEDQILNDYINALRKDPKYREKVEKYDEYSKILNSIPDSEKYTFIDNNGILRRGVKEGTKNLYVLDGNESAIQAINKGAKYSTQEIAEKERFIRDLENEAIKFRSKSKKLGIPQAKYNKPFNNYFNDVQPIYNDLNDIYDKIETLKSDVSSGKVDRFKAEADYSKLVDEFKQKEQSAKTIRESYNISEDDLKSYNNLLDEEVEKYNLLESNFRKRPLLEETDYSAKLKSEKRYAEMQEGNTMATALIAVENLGYSAANQLVFESLKSFKPIGESMNMGQEDYDWSDKLYDYISATQKASFANLGYKKPKNLGDENMPIYTDYQSDLPGLFDSKEEAPLPLSAGIMLNLANGLGSAAAFMTPIGLASKAIKGAGMASKVGRQVLSKGSWFLQMENANYERNLNAGMNPDDASELSILQTIQDIAAESIFNEATIFTKARPAGFMSALRAGATKREALKIGLRWAGKTSRDIAEASVKESFEEGMGQFSQDLGATEANLLYNTGMDKFNDTFKAKSYANSMAVGALVGGFMQGTSSLTVMSPTTMNAMSFMGTNAKEILDQLAILQNKGEIDQKKYDLIKSQLESLSKSSEIAQNTPGFSELSKADQDALIATIHQRNQVSQNVKDIGFETKQAKSMMNILNQRIQNIIDGKRSTDEGSPIFRTYMDANLANMGVAVVDINENGSFNLMVAPGLSEQERKDIVANATKYLSDKIKNDAIVAAKFKPKQDAVQERSTEEVLPRQQGETTETGGQPQGMGQSVQGEEITQQGETEAQRQERIAKEASAGAAEVVTGLNIPNALAASVFPVVGEVEAQMEKGEFVNDEKSTEAQDKLYELLADIDSREDLTPEQKQQMSAVIENRIQKIQDYDYRTRTETRTTTQTVATGVSPKTQKQNERAAIPVRTVAEEGIDVTYDGRRGKVELRNGEYVFIPAKTGAVQGKPVVIGEAAQVNSNSKFAGVENPTKGPNAVVANITLPNGSTLSVLNDDLSVDIGLEIAKQEVGLAPQALFDTVFDEIVTENKVEVPYLREVKPTQQEAATETQAAQEVVAEEQKQAEEVKTTPTAERYTGRSARDLELKRKNAKDSLKRKVLNQADRVTQSLGIDVPVFIHENDEEYNRTLTERGLDMTKDSSSGRFVYNEDGSVAEIHVNLSKATETTIFHEATHAVLFKAFGDNQALFQKFKDKLKPLLANSTVEQLEQFANNANYVAQGVTAEEFLAEFAALMTDQGTRIPKNILQKIAQLINEFVSTITKGKLKPFENTADTANVIDFFNSMADAFAQGKIIDTIKNAEKSLKNNSISSKSQTVSIAKGNETAKKLGLSEKYNNVRKIAEALELRQRKKYGKINKNDFSEEASSKISKWMTDEVIFFVELMGDKSGKGWYGKLFQKGIDNMAQIFPELATDQNSRDLFTMLVAITSDGEKVKSNFRLASIAYDYYRKNKKLPTNLESPRASSINGNMDKLNDLLKEFNTGSQLKDHLLTIKSISNLNKERKVEGLKALNTQWPASFEAPLASSIFGPKLGMFYANLSGQEKYPTLDRWWSRTFNRYRGTLIPQVLRGFDTKNNPIGLDRFKYIAGDPNMSDDQALILINENRNNYKNKKYKNGTELEKAANTLFKQINENINDAPFNKSDREFMYNSFIKAQKSLNKKGYDLSIADIQAILWYYEKFLYKTLGAKGKIDGVSYGDVANFIVEKYKENGNSFGYNINPDEDFENIQEEDEMDDSITSDEKPSLKSKSQQNLVEKAGISSNMTEDDQGNYLFYHYSPNKISSIDPRFFGKNVNRTGRDERPGMNISMYYTSPDVNDVSGDFGYVVRIPKDKVYPFNKDPLDLYDKAKEAFNKKFPGQAFDPNKQVAFISAEAAKLGYPMTVAKWGNNLRAQTTQKMVGEVYTKPSKRGGVDINEDIAQFKVNKKARRSKLKSKSQIEVNPEEIQSNAESKLNEVINGDPESGATFNLDGTTYDGGGLVIPITSVNIDTDKISPKDISDMVEDNIDKIFDDQKIKTGIYKFTDGKQMSVDLNIIVPSDKVEFAKEFARAAGQESIFSLDTYENIKTGSTGENPISFSADEFLEIAEALNEGRLPNISKLEYKPEFKSKSQVITTPKEILKKYPELKNTKVIDNNGDPLLVYHGGPTFTEFKPSQTKEDKGIYFTDNYDFALFFAHQHELAERDKRNDDYKDIPNELLETGEPFPEEYFKYAKVQQAYLDIQNPTIVDSIDAKSIPDNYEEGKDGFIAKSTGDFGYKGSQYVIFETKQIKNALSSKSQVSAIPKASAESKSVVSELEAASNKTGLAKENAVKRFIEKYGEKGVVAKQINDNFDKIQEQLGITKICNI